MVKRNARLQLTTAWTTLLCGACIYLLFRSRSHIGFILLNMMGLASVTDTARALFNDIYVPEFIRFCLPDALWTTSYILFSDYFNRNEGTCRRILMVSAIPILGIGSELLQQTPIVPGTFDWLDIVSYAMPLILYILIIKTKKL